MAGDTANSRTRLSLHIATVAAALALVPAGLVVAHLVRAHSRTADRAPTVMKHRNTGDHRTPAPAPDRHRSPTPHPIVNSGPGVRAVDSAIGSTTSVSNYDYTFNLEVTGLPSGGGRTPSATGYGVVDLNPTALSVSAVTGCIGNVSVRADGDNVWSEWTESDPNGPASQLPNWNQATVDGFQGDVSSCFGQYLSPLATISMCSPEGQLALTTQAIAGATPVGVVTVNGQTAEQYQVTIDPAGFLHQPGTTASETLALETAVTAIGSAPMSATVDVNSSGYIVEMVLSISWANGAVASHQIVLSNFNNAGTVSLPPLQPPGQVPIPNSCLSGGSANSSPPFLPTASCPSPKATKPADVK
jgi:hypothetical protein